mmetsp:Transcript_87825/g.264121  ORF Transcript_87825/g.264121 Transcript_87825/m.264121 type:complete len:113 (+) Transcript_87825:2258-2596(+)
MQGLHLPVDLQRHVSSVAFECRQRPCTSVRDAIVALYWQVMPASSRHRSQSSVGELASGRRKPASQSVQSWLPSPLVAGAMHLEQKVAAPRPVCIPAVPAAHGCGTVVPVVQ